MKTLHFVQSLKPTPVQPVPTGSPQHPPVSPIPTKLEAVAPTQDLVWQMECADDTHALAAVDWMRRDIFPRKFFPEYDYIFRIHFTSRRDSDIVAPPKALRPPLRPTPVVRQDDQEVLPIAA